MSVVGCGGVVTVKSLALVAVPRRGHTNSARARAGGDGGLDLGTGDDRVGRGGQMERHRGHTHEVVVMVTTVPTGPLAGVNDAMVGGETDVAGRT